MEMEDEIIQLKSEVTTLQNNLLELQNAYSKTWMRLREVENKQEQMAGVLQNLQKEVGQAGALAHEARLNADEYEARRVRRDAFGN